MYTVIGDITPFHGMDRWGSDPVRIIAECLTYVGAVYIANKHIARHPHGSASIVKGKQHNLKWAA